MEIDCEAVTKLDTWLLGRDVHVLLGLNGFGIRLMRVCENNS